MTTSNAEATGSFASMEDPFVVNSGRPAVSRDSHRNSSFDTQLYSLNASSPAQAKRALEAHLVETERRLEEASRLGTALIDQQRQLSEQLKEVEQQQNEGEMGPDLRRKLADLEKEYNEIGRESARAFLAPKRLAGGPEDAQLGTPSFDQKSPLSPALFASQATNSPSKVSVPSRKQRNQPSNRVHDIEFATEISTSLLAQVRQLQALLAERDETLKFVNLEKSRLELEAEGYGQRIRVLDDSEQRYKDENWALETQAHELMAAARDAAEREQRLNSTITLSNAEKNAVERELEELRQANARLLEDQSLTQKANDAEIHLLRRNLTSGEAEKSALQKKLMEMTSQNQELAKAVAMRLRDHENQASRDTAYDNEGDEPEHITPESSPPPSPNKFTPRHGHLESETLKSSLGHAHRMIQNLKSTIHREKTEKIELKRMLQDARDEVEQRRRESTAPNGTSKRQKTKTDVSRKPPRPDLLGAGRKEKSFVELHDTDWEDNAGQISPTQTHKAVSTRGRPRSESPDGPSDVYQTATEAEDGFETANERATATESEAFQTGVESMADDSSDSADLTETENNVQTTPRSRVPSSLIMAKARDRTSYHSTASASSDEEEYDGAFGSPSQMHISRPRVKSKRSISRRIRPSGEATFASTSRPSSSRASVAPSFAQAPVAQEGQSLFAELAEFDSTEDDEVTSQASTPRMEPASDSRRPSDAMLDAPPKPPMVDSGVMTEPWEPTPSVSAAGIVAGAAGIAAGAALPHALTATQPSQTADQEIAEETKEIPDLVNPEMGMADVSSQETTPSAPKRPDLSVSYITGGTTTPVKHQLPVPELPEMTISSISSQTTSPIQPTVMVPEPIIKHVDVIKYVEREPEVPELTFSSITTQSTSPVHATLAVPEPIVKYVDVIKHVERERQVPELNISSVAAQSTIPVQAIQATVPEPEPIIKYVDVIKHVEREREIPELTFSSINNQSTVPIQATLAVPEPIIKYVDVIKHVEREVKVPELTFSSITTQTTEPAQATVPEPLPPVIQYVDVIKHIEREREVTESSFSSITTQSTAPVLATLAKAEPVIEYVDVIKHVEREREVPDLTFSSINNQSTAPVHATLAVPEPVIQYVDVIKHIERERKVPESTFSSITTQSTAPVNATLAKAEPVIEYVDVIKHVEREREVPELTFSSITTQTTKPVKATVPEPLPPVIQYVDVIKHVEREREVPVLTVSSLDPAYTEPIIPRSRLVPTPALSFSSVRSVETHPVKSMPFVIPAVADFSTQTEPTESKAAGAAVIVHEDLPTGATRSRTNTANSDQLVGAGLALNDISGNALARSARQQSSSVSMDQGSQTILSSKQIDQILMDRVSARPLSSDSQVTDNSREIAAVTTSAAAPYVTPKAPTRPRLSQIQSAKSTTPISRRPTSAASQTSGASHPPLPFDHREAIMAAEKRSIDIAPPSPTSVMGPPLAPASAYRMNSQRPLTPSEQAARASSSRTGSSQARMRRGSQGQMSRRSSVSSFASEIEERFNMAPHAGPMPQGYGPNTDPRMIQAITQTMIGEFLWKYTRKTGSSDMSTTRHRRYFWVHPYTRTLYWSTQDPQTAGKSELRTKSVPIEAVRVVADDNPYPPGLHCRSLEVVSPGRRVRFTATTSQRHETWFNALSYLLLRETNENCEDNNSVTLDDINEFNPPSFRSGSRQTARMSFSSYNSRTARNAHKQQRRAASAMSMRSSGTLGGRASPALSSPVPNPNSSLQVPDDRQRSSSRLSTISSSIRGSIASLKGRPGQSPSVHNESLHGQESADDLRQAVEAQEQDRLENVRACCDGKHDVGSLSRTSRYSPRINRIHSPHRH
ncbi:Pleckstrin homology domain Mcp5-type [Penicillium concentricum]|uniref:Pleckstrin homology domain Mcp5-type n=1 Tax=Penicillium concentricum TaxID=293559 RepID=A0A9W9RML4_9EURO|nr:Pleckstrin homology domain Mcp5-type [Penicillium concentricum]KAJ5360343.1 Pleckstrin homology domain Mcp5-type [Penicillium concentricum]